MAVTVAQLRAIGDGIVGVRSNGVTLQGRLVRDRLSDDAVMALFEDDQQREFIVALEDISEIVER